MIGITHVPPLKIKSGAMPNRKSIWPMPGSLAFIRLNYPGRVIRITPHQRQTLYKHNYSGVSNPALIFSQTVIKKIRRFSP
jgi:hypothetical protein